jgi:hypothetical protein
MKPFATSRWPAVTPTPATYDRIAVIVLLWSPIAATGRIQSARFTMNPSGHPHYGSNGALAKGEDFLYIQFVTGV